MKLGWGGRALGRHFRIFRWLRRSWYLRHDAMLSEGGILHFKGGTASPEGGNIFFSEGGIMPSDGGVLFAKGGRVSTQGVMLHLKGGIMPSECSIQPYDGDIMLSEGGILHSKGGTTSPGDGNTQRAAAYLRRAAFVRRGRQSTF